MGFTMPLCMQHRCEQAVVSYTVVSCTVKSVHPIVLVKVIISVIRLSLQRLKIRFYSILSFDKNVEELGNLRRLQEKLC